MGRRKNSSRSHHHRHHGDKCEGLKRHHLLGHQTGGAHAVTLVFILLLRSRTQSAKGSSNTSRHPLKVNSVYSVNATTGTLLTSDLPL